MRKIIGALAAIESGHVCCSTKRVYFRLIGTFVVLVAMHGWFTPSAAALVLDWSSLSWTPGAIDTTYDIDPSKPGTERVQFTSFTSEFAPNHPQINSALEGGQGAGNRSLNLSVDLSREDRFITVTVSFAGYTLGVEGVSFTLFNIDRDGAIYVDEIRSITGTAPDGVTLVAPTITNVGPNVALTGSGLNQVLTGTTPVPDTGAGSGAGNATISFNSPVRSFTFVFGADLASSRNPPAQAIAIGDVTFSPVPELNPAALAVTVCGASLVVRWRRARSAHARNE